MSKSKRYTPNWGDSLERGMMYRNFAESVSEIGNAEIELLLFKAFIRYVFEGEEPDFSILNDSACRIAKTIWTANVSDIHTYCSRAYGGNKGGAPKGNKNAVKKIVSTLSYEPAEDESTAQLEDATQSRNVEETLLVTPYVEATPAESTSTLSDKPADPQQENKRVLSIDNEDTQMLANICKHLKEGGVKKTITEKWKVYSDEDKAKVQSFIEWWSNYPKKIEQFNTFKKWMKIATSTIPLIMEHTPKYIVSCSKSGTYIKYPLTYLNGECWNDDVPTDNKPTEPATATQSIKEQKERYDAILKAGKLPSEYSNY